MNAGTRAPLLEIRGLTKRYGSIQALDDVSFDVAVGARHVVIGPNGAGKSTFFKLVTGGITATEGSLAFAGNDITRLSEVRRARRGIAQTFQHSSVFLDVSAGENVALAAQRAHGRPQNPWRSGSSYHAVTACVDECLEAVGLSDRRRMQARHLSHGERQQLEVALALAMRPQMLLLDEPTAGMSSSETERFVGLVRSLPSDVTILLIEHDLKVVFALATDVTVFHLGRLLATGSPASIRESAAVREAYLGAGASDDRPRRLVR